MKFSKLMATTYDAGTKTLTFSGQTGGGLPAAVEMPLEDENVFLAVMAARLYDGKPSPEGDSKAIVAEHLNASFRVNSAGEHSIAFTARSGSVPLHFILPIQTSDASKIEQIKMHMKEMFELLAEQDKRVTH